MKVAITGGHGFIGKAISFGLSQNGHEVDTIDRSSGRDIFHPHLTKWCEADVVIHLAGILGTEELFDTPYDAIRTNIEGTVRVLQACHATGAKFLGITMPDVWANVYQSTKRAAKDLATAWHINYNLPVAHVLAYNVFGPGQKVRGVQKIVPTFAHRAWRGEPLPMWGSGEQIVDLVPVGMVAAQFLTTIEQGEFKDNVVHAGSGRPQKVIDVANRINEWTGNPAGIKYLPMRKGEGGHIAVAPRQTIRCEPLNKLLRGTVDWYRTDRP